MGTATFGPPEDAQHLHFASCFLPFCFLLRTFTSVCELHTLVVDVKEFKVSPVLKLLLILSLVGTQGGGHCMVLQLSAIWDYQGSQLGGDPNYT